jgi:hypothetical protein
MLRETPDSLVSLTYDEHDQCVQRYDSQHFRSFDRRKEVTPSAKDSRMADHY